MSHRPSTSDTILFVIMREMGRGGIANFRRPFGALPWLEGDAALGTSGTGSAEERTLRVDLVPEVVSRGQRGEEIPPLG
jgi:hypothetical protein